MTHRPLALPPKSQDSLGLCVEPWALDLTRPSGPSWRSEEGPQEPSPEK